jgi:hypothetical protein
MGVVRFGLAALLSVALASYAAWAEPSIFPTGTTRYDPGKAYNSFILFSGADDETYLIDMNGKVVHRWGYGGFPAGMLDPKLTGGKRGHVVLQLAQTAGVATGVNPGLPAMFSNKTLGAGRRRAPASRLAAACEREYAGARQSLSSYRGLRAFESAR